ncbi:hypothetical protein ACMFMG_001785 [Clarireedia jacksonii]
MHIPFTILPARRKKTPFPPIFHHGIPPSPHQESKRSIMVTLSCCTDYCRMRAYWHIGNFFSWLDDNMILLDSEPLGRKNRAYRHRHAHAIVAIRSEAVEPAESAPMHISTVPIYLKILCHIRALAITTSSPTNSVYILQLEVEWTCAGLGKVVIVQY